MFFSLWGWEIGRYASTLRWGLAKLTLGLQQSPASLGDERGKSYRFAGVASLLGELAGASSIDYVTAGRGRRRPAL